MAKTAGIWGVDIGQSTVKAVRVELIDGQVSATAFDFIEHPKVLSQPDADPDQLIREALVQFLSRNPIKGDQVAISIPGQSGLARFVKLPPVEEKKIVDIVRFEAKQQIPFPLEEVVWDYQKIGQGTVTDGFAVDTEIGLFAMKRDVISRYLGHFNGVDIPVHFVQMTPLALCNYAIYDVLKLNSSGLPDSDDGAEPTSFKKNCVVIMDIGTEGSNLIITDGKRIIWQRPIPLGGNNFTRALTKELKMTFAKAEHLKRNAAKSPELPNILKALKPVLTEFVDEVQRSLRYFTNTHKDANVVRLIGLGGAFRLPGLQKYLSDKLQLEVLRPSKFEKLFGDVVISNSVFTENILSFPVAYGLAIQGLRLSRISTNLLPPEISFDRKIRAKKPWAVVSAATLLFGTTALAFFSSIPFETVNAESLAKQIKSDSDEIKRSQTVNSEISSREKEVETTKLDVLALIAGQEERINWIRLNEFINRSLPMPGKKEEGGTLDDPERRPLWQTDAARRATEVYKERLKAGIDPQIGWDDFTRSALCTVDLEGVTCRYTDNLKTYFEKVKKDSKTYTGEELAGMLPEDLNKPPEGAGWVVELRGTSSYFQKTKINGVETDFQGREFILATLVKNLQMEAKALLAAGGATNPTTATTGNATTPAGTPGTTPAGSNSNQKTDPIQVSHVFLWAAFEDKEPKLNEFKFLTNKPLVDYVVTDPVAPGSATGTTTTPATGTPTGMSGGTPTGMSGGTPTGMMGGMPSGMAGGTTSGTSATNTSWTRLTSGEGGEGSGLMAGMPRMGGNKAIMGGMPSLPSGGMLGSGGSGSGAGDNPYRLGTTGTSEGGSGGFGPMLGGPKGSSGKKSPFLPGGTSPIGPNGGGNKGNEGTNPEDLANKKKIKKHSRYEFVVLFVWKEPTPSDRYLKK